MIITRISRFTSISSPYYNLLMTYSKLTISEMNRLTPEAFHEAEKLPLIVVLDNVRSQHNVGAVFRTADAFLLQGVWTCGISPTPDNVEVHKTALGAEQTVNTQHFADTMDAIAALRAQGYAIYAIEQAHNSITLDNFINEVLPQLNAEAIDGEAPNRSSAAKREAPNGSPTGIAIILGHEVFGVQQAVIDASDGCIEIPQYGTKHSLNVSVTAGIVMYEISNHLTRSRA